MPNKSFQRALLRLTSEFDRSSKLYLPRYIALPKNLELTIMRNDSIVDEVRGGWIERSETHQFKGFIGP